jgi:hypothetical protein
VCMYMHVNACVRACGCVRMFVRTGDSLVVLAPTAATKADARAGRTLSLTTLYKRARARAAVSCVTSTAAPHPHTPTPTHTHTHPCIHAHIHARAHTDRPSA